VLSIQEDESKPAELQEVMDVVTTAKLITEVVTAASITITAAEVPVPVAITAAAFKLTAAPRRTKGVQIEQDEQYARELEAELNMNIDWDEVINHVKKKAKEYPAVKRYQALKRKPQTEAQSRKNMMIYLKNVAGFKMDYFKGMSYDDIRPTFEAKEDLEALWSLVKERFATTKSKNFFDDFLLITLGAMFEKPYIHAQIWKNQRSVHGPAKVKGWKLLESYAVQIITFTTTQLILLVERKYPLTRFTLDHMLNDVRLEVEEEGDVSLELLREDLEALWSLVKERFATTKSKNFFDDFLLITLGAMFEKPYIHAQIWKNQRSVHGPAKVKGWKLLESYAVQIITFTTTQLILLVERKYPLTRFTLDHMLNDVRLEVEEEGDVSLELLRFIRQQHQEGAHIE
nr:hypothetical protein [Tanacetum cinerariifolium]